jgi:hypothetical protein
MRHTTDVNSKSFSVAASPMRGILVLQPTLQQDDQNEHIAGVEQQPSFVQKLGDLQTQGRFIELRPVDMHRAYSEQISIMKEQNLIKEAN